MLKNSPKTLKPQDLLQQKLLHKVKTHFKEVYTQKMEGKIRYNDLLINRAQKQISSLFLHRSKLTQEGFLDRNDTHEIFCCIFMVESCYMAEALHKYG